MTATDWTLIGMGILTALAGSGGIVAYLKVRQDREAGVSSDERQARQDEASERRDTIADREALIASMGLRLLRVEERLSAAEDGNLAKALTIRAQGDHIDVLEHHIWQGKPPPPPPRPAGA